MLPSSLNAKNIVIFIIGIGNGMQYSTIAASGIDNFYQPIKPCYGATENTSASRPYNPLVFHPPSS